jgi:hypothetical protein
LGLHEDGYFHPECPICFGEAVTSYRAECHQILDGLGASPSEFDHWFNIVIAHDQDGLTLCDEPATLIATFLGIELHDGTWAQNPAWQRIEDVAHPLRLARIARTRDET